MRNLISILLLACLTLPFIGTVSWLNYQRKTVRRQIKHQIIAGIDKSELVLLIFTKEELDTKLKWKHSKEFEYNNSMYDIVEADTINNIVTYWCWWDYEETKLNKQLTTLLADFLGNDQQNKEAKSRFANFYQTLYHSQHKQWEAINTEIQIEKNNCYLFKYTSIYFPPLVPPPNFS